MFHRWALSRPCRPPNILFTVAIQQRPPSSKCHAKYSGVADIWKTTKSPQFFQGPLRPPRTNHRVRNPQKGHKKSKNPCESPASPPPEVSAGPCGYCDLATHNSGPILLASSLSRAPSPSSTAATSHCEHQQRATVHPSPVPAIPGSSSCTRGSSSARWHFQVTPHDLCGSVNPGRYTRGSTTAPLLSFLEPLLQVAGPPRCSARLNPEICVIWKLPSCPT